jgi:hypothetical protein
MASADVSAIVDLASSVDPTPTPEVTPTEVPEVTTPDIPTLEGETPEAETPDAPEGEITPVDPDPKVDGRTNPAAVRSALKAFRDADPKNAAISRELNDSYGRWQAAKQVFPGGVTEMRNVKSFIDANGGVEGLTTLHETIKQVNETDGLLYAGDPRVLDNIIEDMRRENKLESFSKLAGPFLDKLRGLDEKSYFNTLKPHFYQGLVDTGVPNVVGQLAKLLSNATPDVEGAKGLLTEFSNWLNGLRDSVERTDRTKLDPERQAFEQERTQFASEKQKEFQTGVASSADQYNNESLGKALRPFVKLPFFKNLTDKGKLSLAREMKSTLMEELTADKTYQSQMDAFFGAKAPDKSRISQFHNSKVDTMAQRIVKQVIETRYPDYAKRAAVAAKPGAPVAKPVTDPTQANKPEFVKSKPKWEDLDMDKDAQRMLFITGRGFRKSDGKLITWNPKYK